MMKLLVIYNSKHRKIRAHIRTGDPPVYKKEPVHAHQSVHKKQVEIGTTMNIRSSSSASRPVNKQVNCGYISFTVSVYVVLAVLHFCQDAAVLA